MTRIDLNDTMQSVVIKMAEGNPGALRVCMDLLAKGEQIDPDDWAGGFGNLLSLDTLAVYGSRIWMLFKDVCDLDLIKTIAMLRAWQLGFTTRESLNYAIDNRGAGLDVDTLLAQVKERLPNFGVAQQE